MLAIVATNRNIQKCIVTKIYIIVLYFIVLYYKYNIYI